MTMEEDAIRRDLATDVLVDILLRLPPSSRRRSRLVCRRWRDVINDRTTEMHSRPKLLIWETRKNVAYVVNDSSSSSTGSCKLLWWDRGVNCRRRSMQLVGTCNGLLCLCDNERFGGAITLVNPATGETLPAPPLECADWSVKRPSRECRRWHKAYSLAYHPTSGRYTVVHVPCYYINHECKCDCVHDAMQVLTLGESSWREVPAAGLEGIPIPWYNLGTGIISVDGSVHWVTRIKKDAAAIVSFDLEDESITSATLQSSLPAEPKCYSLTEVHGRLGIVITDRFPTTEVWVMEETRRWSRRYIVDGGKHLLWPYFVYDEHVLTLEKSSVYGHHTRKGTPSLEALVDRRDQGTLVAKMESGYFYYRNKTSAYVETEEPLSVYSPN